MIFQLLASGPVGTRGAARPCIACSVAILDPTQRDPVVERIFHDAGPTGYDLARLLCSLGVRCDVVAPSLVPNAPGDRVKTDRRDCRRLARLHRAGELVAIRIPAPAEEAVRDLCRARADMVEDRTRARHRLSKFLLRHGRVFGGAQAWTLAHDQWLRSLSFDDPDLTTTFRHYMAVLVARDAALSAVQADLGPHMTSGL